ncbi:unnamed protein product [Kuraishia capsulata CBS 1993]|uniref:LYC1 C-terminal domain-containing protein n=1 Tax=Kuraishia capsulata CBS 1993 TaxID=1382522 RepID=W6MNS4_9ASCO|nr:uncharacterized protein KUCA_T00003908001 [Kuraishia capsulata CBS 1993]CDK27928.1 unnamed protein product [Kuraishia capsulata CBS 1993]
MTKSLVLEETFDREVIRHCHLRNGENWRGPLALEVYADREAYLATASNANIPRRLETQELSGLHYWVLRDKSLKCGSDDNPKTYNVVAACESYFRDWWRVDYDAETGAAQTKVVSSPCVGGVYTLPAFRGKGLATFMISELNRHFGQMSDPDSFATLYSEVGEYYSRFGYESSYVPKFELQVQDIDLELPEAEWHPAGEMAGLAKTYSSRLLSHIQARTLETRTTTVALIPSQAVYDWHHLRSVFYAERLHNLKPGNFAVSINKDSETVGFAVFTVDYLESSIFVISFFAESSKVGHQLIQLLFQEANRVGFKKIQGWVSDVVNYNFVPDLDFQKELSEKYMSNFEVENHSLSALWPISGKGPINWEDNGKLAWF